MDRQRNENSEILTVVASTVLSPLVPLCPPPKIKASRLPPWIKPKAARRKRHCYFFVLILIIVMLMTFIIIINRKQKNQESKLTEPFSNKPRPPVVVARDGHLAAVAGPSVQEPVAGKVYGTGSREKERPDLGDIYGEDPRPELYNPRVGCTVIHKADGNCNTELSPRSHQEYDNATIDNTNSTVLCKSSKNFSLIPKSSRAFMYLGGFCIGTIPFNTIVLLAVFFAVTLTVIFLFIIVYYCKRKVKNCIENCTV